MNDLYVSGLNFRTEEPGTGSVVDLPGLRRELLKIGQYQDRNANEKLAALPLLSNP